MSDLCCPPRFDSLGRTFKKSCEKSIKVNVFNVGTGAAPWGAKAPLKGKNEKRGYFHASKLIKLAFLSSLLRKYMLWKGFYHDFSTKKASASGGFAPQPWGGGHLQLKLDIIHVKQIHVIRVVFQDQTMYARTSIRGPKMCKTGKKGVFWS